MRNYGNLAYRAYLAGASLPAVPRLAELLGDPAFHALAEWFRFRDASREKLQPEIDHYLENIRSLAIAQAKAR